MVDMTSPLWAPPKLITLHKKEAPRQDGQLLPPSKIILSGRLKTILRTALRVDADENAYHNESLITGPLGFSFFLLGKILPRKVNDLRILMKWAGVS